MKILLTGASGFLGKIINSCLKKDNEIYSLSRNGGDILSDLSNKIPALPYVDAVIHAAGKAHFSPKTREEKNLFFNVNVTGTENLLKGLNKSDNLPKYFVFISSVAVYGKETGHLITEDTPLLATDAYGQSKIRTEELVKNWCNKNNVICTIFRLPLLVGPNPPGNLGTMIKGIKKGYYFNIAGGTARKSMVLAEDIALIIPTAAKVGGIYNLTDRVHPTVKELSHHITNQLQLNTPYNISFTTATFFARIGNLLGNNAHLNSIKLKKIISELTFDDSKAVKEIGWVPRNVLKNLRIDSR